MDAIGRKANLRHASFADSATLTEFSSRSPSGSRSRVSVESFRPGIQSGIPARKSSESDPTVLGTGLQSIKRLHGTPIDGACGWRYFETIRNRHRRRRLLGSPRKISLQVILARSPCEEVYSMKRLEGVGGPFGVEVVRPADGCCYCRSRNFRGGKEMCFALSKFASARE